MTRVHLPSGIVVTTPNDDVRPELADYCPRREEHTTSRSRRTHTPVVHDVCGLRVIWIPNPKAKRR